tara:strand:- start:1858 stop:2496 length:639 start_codon:yes stop_codon:yes gene_type:complete
MKISKRQLRRLIREAVTARGREGYDQFKKSRELPKFDDQFLRSFEDDEGRLDPKQLDRADKHYDDAVARSEGYKDAMDKLSQEWPAEIEAERAAREERNRRAREFAGIDNPNFNVEYYSKFNLHKSYAEKALASGNDREFESNYGMMARFGNMMYGPDSGRWKEEEGVPALMKAYEEITAGSTIDQLIDKGVDFFDYKRSPTLKALGLFDDK